MRHGSCTRDMTHAHYSFIFMTLEHQALCQWRHTCGVSKEQRKSARRNGRKEEDWNTGKRDQRYHQGSSTLFPRADCFWDSGSGQPENCGRGVGAGRGAHAERGERRRAGTGETNHVINNTRHCLFVLADFGTRGIRRQVSRSGRLRELSEPVFSKDGHLP